MKNAKLLVLLVATFVVPLLAISSAHAQATRTWVSGVGDDVNPCSRTAPCKTFAGAISKTAASGEINCLDGGGFGAVTITKAITISCEAGTGGILAAGVSGIIINAVGAGDVVVLRGLDIEGAGTGLNGINILDAKSVHIERVTINGFNGAPGNGIRDVRTGPAQLFVTDTAIRNNDASGIVIVPGAGTIIGAVLTNVQSFNNNYGVAAAAGARVTITRSQMSWNTTAGIEADPLGILMADGNVFSNNGTGVLASAGSSITLSNNNILSNNFPISGATTSFGNNRLVANVFAGTGPAAAGAATANLGQQ